MQEFLNNIIEGITLEAILQDAVLLFRILLAAFCGFIIGLERKNRGKGAGVRTHIIVALGSALMMVISKYGFFDIATGDSKFDGARIAAQIVSGIGFLGAGMIFVKGNAIQGLTTAAGVWATAGIGMAVGAGMYFVGITASLSLFLIQLILHRNWHFLHRENEQNLEIVIENTPQAIDKLKERLESFELPIHQSTFKRLDDGKILVTITTILPENFNHLEFLKQQGEFFDSIVI